MTKRRNEITLSPAGLNGLADARECDSEPVEQCRRGRKLGWLTDGCQPEAVNTRTQTVIAIQATQVCKDAPFIKD